MSSERDKNQRSLFDQQAKDQQKQDLRRAYVKERRKLDRQLAVRRTKADDARTQLDQLRSESKSQADVAQQRELKKLDRAVENKQKEIAGLPERQRLGEASIDSATIHQGPDGAITIRSKMGPSQPRLGYENSRTSLDNRSGMERCHSQGAGTGFECDHGILHASKSINHGYQNHGVEEFGRELYVNKRPGSDLWLTTVTRAKPGTNELHEIEYQVTATAPRQRESRVCGLTIQADKSGKVNVHDASFSPNADQHLKQLPDRRAVAAKAAQRQQTRAARKQQAGGAKQTRSQKTQKAASLDQQAARRNAKKRKQQPATAKQSKPRKTQKAGSLDQQAARRAAKANATRKKDTTSRKKSKKSLVGAFGKSKPSKKQPYASDLRKRQQTQRQQTQRQSVQRPAPRPATPSVRGPRK